MAVNIDTIQVEIEASSDKAAKRVQELADALASLKSNARGGAGLVTVSDKIKTLISNTNGATSASNKINKLAAALKSLESVQKPAALSNIANSLNKLNGLDLSGISTEKMQTLASALNQLGSVQKASGLASTINALKKLPTISAELKEADLGKFATQMQQVATAMAPLANQMQKVSSGFAAFPIRIQKIIASNAGLAASNAKAAKSFNLFGPNIAGTISKLAIFGFGIKQAIATIGGFVQKSNDYVENLNLFTVAMGGGAQAALDYAEEVQNALGIDMSQFIRNQGIFKQIASGFGVVEEKANLMSKNLTQLGYDISSFFNISIEDAMLKLQSGISGELEPLRRLGYALDVATLQQIAYDNGITQNINTMTQAQKSQLRYVAIMQQSTNAMGDMAATLMTPANALRILEQQIGQLARAVGNLLIPFLMKVIPYVQAFVEIVIEAVQALAALAGFELPEIKHSNFGEIVGGLADESESASGALDGAAQAAKELKNAVLGIDELNIISPQEEMGKVDTPKLNGGLGADLGLKLPEYDFLKGIQDETETLKKNMKELIDDYIKPVAEALAGLAIAKLIKDLGDAVSKFGDLKKLLTAAVIVTLEFSIDKWSIEKYLDTGDLRYLLLNMFTTAAAAYLLYKTFGAAGLLIGVGVGVVASIVGISTKLANGDLFYDDPKVWIAAAFTTAMGGIGAAIGLSKLGFFAGEGFLIGLSVTLALTLTGINFGAIAGGQYDSGSAQSIVMSVLSTAMAGIGGYVLAGALVAGAGPVGLAIGLGVGLIVNIVSMSIAEDQARQLMVDNAFFDDQGVLIADLAGEYDNLIQKVSDAQQPTIIAWDAIASGKEGIQEVTDGLVNLANQVDLGYISIEETMPLIADEFNQLYADTVDVLNQEADLIYTALAGSTGEALADMGFDLEKVGLLVSSVVNETSLEIEQLKLDNEALQESLSSGTADSGAMTKYLENAKKIAEMSGVDTSGLDAFKDTLANLIPEDINWKTDDLSGVFDSIATSTNDAKIAIEEASGATIDALEHLKTLTVDPEEVQMFDSIIAAFNADKKNKMKEIENITSTFVGGLQTNLITSVDDQVNAAMENWDSLSWLTKTFKYNNNQADYVKQALTDYQNNIVDPITSDMKEAFTGALSGDTVWADEAMGSLLDSMFGQIEGHDAVGYYVTYTTSFAKDVTTAIDDVLPEYMKKSGLTATEEFTNGIKENTEIATGAANGLGTDVMSGLELGISENTHLATNAILDAMGDASLHTGVIGTAFEAADAHSPSLVFKNLGMYLMEGLRDGIAEFSDIVETPFTTLLNAMLVKMETFTNRCRDALNILLSDFSSSMASVSIDSDGWVSYDKLAPVRIQQFALGGFPEHGQMFIANEAGPEMVGTIGGQTAVANNDEITTAIQQAVYRAVVEAMAQRQEQPIVIEQEISLDGKTITRNVEKHQRERGVSIMPGGVMVR